MGSVTPTPRVTTILWGLSVGVRGVRVAALNFVAYLRKGVRTGLFECAGSDQDGS